jgi:hypothetical protein
MEFYHTIPQGHLMKVLCILETIFSSMGLTLADSSVHLIPPNMNSVSFKDIFTHYMTSFLVVISSTHLGNHHLPRKVASEVGLQQITPHL